MGLPASALQFVCPVVAAAVLVYRQGGTAGVVDLLKRTVRPQLALCKPWYLVSVSLVPAALLLSYWALRLAGLPLTGPVSSVRAAPALLLVFLIAAACEEAGWMGYAVNPLRRRWGALSTGVVLGVVWGVFHLVPLLEAHRTPTWIAGWFLSTVAARVLIVWLYSSTRKAILPAIFFHAMLNVGGSFFPNDNEAYTQIAFGIVLGLAAVVAVVVWGPKTLSGPTARAWQRRRPRPAPWLTAG
ncbi:MAG: CPBP family glutamic-type intramembrane protease [Pseudonocardiaceae bacterium]